MREKILSTLTIAINLLQKLSFTNLLVQHIFVLRSILHLVDALDLQTLNRAVDLNI